MKFIRVRGFVGNKRFIAEDLYRGQSLEEIPLKNVPRINTESRN